SKRLKIRNIIKDVDYDGGYLQQGGKFIGSGTAEEKARLILHRNKKPFVLVESKVFSIKGDRISSNNAGITIYMEEDSITHPGLSMKLFLGERRELQLVRTGEGLSKSPYYNTYHELDMYFEELSWKLDEPIIKMGPLKNSSDRRAVFESSEYYKESRFDRLMGLGQTHPLVQIKDCTQKWDSRELSVKDVAGCMGVSKSNAKQFLLSLTVKGFVDFNLEDDYCIVQDKLFQYIYAKSEQTDYDALTFRSEVSDDLNASINLLEDIFELNLRGVRHVVLSDSHSVVVFPKDREMTVKKNRDFDFNGRVFAGKFEFYGSNYAFTYDDFQIDMPQVDSLKLNVDTDRRGARGEKLYRRVRTIIEDLNGQLEIDDPGNKSGLQDLPHYPIFKSEDQSYVFYDKFEVEKGVYNRDNFYVQLEPFTFDSVD
ncbi:MAG: hypothetical protein AAGB22_13240, partial [Bacteroidota bacterium]